VNVPRRWPPCSGPEAALADPLASDDVRLLAEVGFLAAARADVRRAEVIFGALERVRPTHGFPYAGLAACYMNAGRGDDAVRVLERGTAQVPPEAFTELEAFRALALHLAGRNSESQRAAHAAGSAPLALAMRGQSTIPPQEF